jgi:hypothetical protein
MDMKTLKWIAIVLLVAVVVGAGIYWMVSGMSRGGLEGFQATSTTTANTITLTTSVEKTSVTMGPYNIQYKYVTDKENLVQCYITGVTGKFTLQENKISDNYMNALDSKNYVIKPKTELIWMKFANGTPDNSKNGANDDFYLVAHPGLDANKNIINTGKPTYIMPSHIICKALTDIPTNVYLFHKDLLLEKTIDDNDVYKMKDNDTPIDINLYVTNQGLLRSMATNDSIEKTVFKYANYGTGKYKCFGFVGDELTNLSNSKQYPYIFNTKSINPYFNSFSRNNNKIYNINPIFQELTIKVSTLDTTLTSTQSDLTKTQSELLQKKNNLNVASAALNNAISEATKQITEGFQATSTTTTTTQPVSPILDKINQLKKLQAKRFAELAAAKASQTSLQSNLKAASNALNSVISSATTTTQKIEGFQDTTTSTTQPASPILAKINQLKEIQTSLQSNKSLLETEKTNLQSNKSRLETENAALLSKKTELENQIKAAEAQLKTIQQTIETALATKSGFQDVAASPSLTDDITKLEQLINELKNEKTNAVKEISMLKGQLVSVSANQAVNETDSNRLKTLETILNNSQLPTNDLTALATKLKTNQNCPPAPVCPSAPNCPPAPVCPPAQDITAIQQPLKDTITELENKIIFKDKLLQAADEEYKKLEDLLKEPNTALTDKERVELTQAKLKAEETLKLTELDRNEFMRQRDDLKVRLNSCEQSKLNMPGPGMGSRPPEYVCRPTFSMNSKFDTPRDILTPATLLPQGVTSPAMPVPGMPVPAMPVPGSENKHLAERIPEGGLAQVSFTNISKTQPPYTWENPYWTYRPENYDANDRYALATPAWWITGHNA